MQTFANHAITASMHSDVGKENQWFIRGFLCLCVTDGSDSAKLAHSKPPRETRKLKQCILACKHISQTIRRTLSHFFFWNIDCDLMSWSAQCVN